MTTNHHRLLVLRRMVHELNAEIDRLIAEGIEAADTPANDAPPKAKRLTRTEAEVIAVRRLTESGALRKGGT